MTSYISFIYGIIVYISLFALYIIPFVYWSALVRWTLKNKWKSTILERNYMILLYVIFPPLSWYDASMQMIEKKRIPRKTFSIIMCIYIFSVWHAISILPIIYPETLYIKVTLPLMCVFYFSLPGCIIYSKIIRRNK